MLINELTTIVRVTLGCGHEHEISQRHSNIAPSSLEKAIPKVHSDAFDVEEWLYYMRNNGGCPKCRAQP